MPESAGGELERVSCIHVWDAILSEHLHFVHSDASVHFLELAINLLDMERAEVAGTRYKLEIIRGVISLSECVSVLARTHMSIAKNAPLAIAKSLR